MTRDEIRALIGAYATGSLTEAEKSALFAAALEDQELFDELANEQALKNVIDEPGARDRLIRSLEPVRNVAWWQRPWPWVTAATVAAAVIAMFLLRPIPKTTEIARLETPRVEPRIQKTAPQLENAPAAPPPVAPPTPRRVTPAKAAPAEPSPAAPPPPAPAATGVIGGVLPPAASAPMAARRDFAPRSAKDATTESTNAVAAPAPMAQAAAARAPVPAEKARAQSITGSLTAPFGLHYSIDWSGDAAITADANGYLALFAESNHFRTAIFPLAQVRAGSTTRVSVPQASDAIVIQFTASAPDSTIDSSPLTQTSNATGQAASADSKLRVRISK